MRVANIPSLKSEKKKGVGRLLQIIEEEGLRNAFYRVLKVLVMRLIRYKREIVYRFYRLLFGSVIREVNGSRMYLDLKDKGVSRDLLLDGKREIISTDYLLSSNILKEGDVVLDIGANIGYYALIESKLIGDRGKVYAVEPVSTNIDILKKNIGLNDCKNIKIFNFAIGDTNKKSRIYISDRCNLCSIGKKPEGVIDEQIVDVLTVDSLLKGRDNPNLIRMDVEGYEYNVIKGMCKTLENDVKIFMEVHGPFLTRKQLEEMFDILKQHDFQVQCIMMDRKNKPSKIVKYFMDKLNERDFGFLNMDMEELLKWLIKEKGYPHVCFSKKSLEEV